MLEPHRLHYGLLFCMGLGRCLTDVLIRVHHCRIIWNSFLAPHTQSFHYLLIPELGSTDLSMVIVFLCHGIMQLAKLILILMTGLQLVRFYRLCDHRDEDREPKRCVCPTEESALS